MRGRMPRTIQGALPYARRLGWLQCSGAQFFQTDFVPDQNTRVVCQLTMTSDASPNFLFGAREAALSRAFNLVAYLGSYRYDFGAGQQTLREIASGETVVVDANQNVISLNGSATTLTAQNAFSAPTPLVLFGCDTNGTATPSAGLRAGEWELYDGTALVRHYIPVMDRAGVPCLYDQVGRALLYATGGTPSYGEVGT